MSCVGCVWGVHDACAVCLCMNWYDYVIFNGVDVVVCKSCVYLVFALPLIDFPNISECVSCLLVLCGCDLCLHTPVVVKLSGCCLSVCLSVYLSVCMAVCCASAIASVVCACMHPS